MFLAKNQQKFCVLAKINDTFNYILKILISGGAELLFGKVKKHNVVLPEAEKPCKFAF